MNKTLVFITIGLIGAYVVKKISMAKKLSYSFAGIQLSSQILSSNVYIKINVTNPTSTTSTIKNIVGDLFFNGVNIGTCITDKKFFIAANATTKIEVICNVKNIAVLSSLFVAISQKKGLFTFKGFITADGFRLPLNFDYSL